MDAGETGVDIFRAFAGLGLTKSTTSCPKREENDLGVIGAGRSPYKETIVQVRLDLLSCYPHDPRLKHTSDVTQGNLHLW